MLSILVYALTALSDICCGIPSHLHIVGDFETDDCNLRILEDDCSGRSVLIKMIRSLDPEEQALLIIDSCAAAIAKTISLPINQVELLPYQEPWSECEWHTQLATLHQFAQGQSTEDFLPWEEFTMHQRYHRGSPAWQKWGPLLDDAKGLTQEVIATMACHDDLARIAAFDTFVGNDDRSLPNLYYCQETDRFFGIDLAASFRFPLAKIAINQLKKLNENGFSKEEVAGLKIYHQTLVELQKAVSPAFMKCLLESLATQSELEGISNRMYCASEKFSANYIEIIKLIALLEVIFEDPGPTLSNL